MSDGKHTPGVMHYNKFMGSPENQKTREKFAAALWRIQDERGGVEGTAYLPGDYSEAALRALGVGE